MSEVVKVSTVLCCFKLFVSEKLVGVQTLCGFYRLNRLLRAWIFKRPPRLPGSPSQAAAADAICQVNVENQQKIMISLPWVGNLGATVRWDVWLWPEAAGGQL